MRAAWLRPMGKVCQQRPCTVLKRGALRAFIEYEDLKHNPPKLTTRWVPLAQLHQVDEPADPCGYPTARAETMVSADLQDLAARLNAPGPEIAPAPFALSHPVSRATGLQPGLRFDDGE